MPQNDEQGMTTRLYKTMVGKMRTWGVRTPTRKACRGLIGAKAEAAHSKSSQSENHECAICFFRQLSRPFSRFYSGIEIIRHVYKTNCSGIS